MSNELPPAGWYPNPDGSGGVRWWSGVGWTEYSRAGAAAPDQTQSEPPVVEPQPVQDLTEPAPPDQDLTQQLAQPDQAQTQQLTGPTTVMPEAPQTWGEQPAAPPATNPWAPPGGSWGQPAAPAYGAYQPPPKQPLTPSRMRPLSAMFSDIGRIVRRGWLPILGISMAIWAVVSVVYVVAFMTTVDLSALQRGFDLIGAETSSETGLATNDAEIAAAFRDAFAALSPSGWALLVTVLTVLILIAASLQTAGVSRVAMDAAAGQPVTWGAGWRACFSGGLRLFGYYLLLGILAGAAWTVAVVVVVGLWAVSPALSVVIGILGFLGLLVLTFWLSGRLIPVIVQAVMGRHAIAWSWQHTRGKFWAVLGRYLLWSMAASVIVNIVVSVISIPLSLILLGTTASTSSTTQIGTSMVLSLITLPLTMALSAVTFIGVVPIWRDLTEDDTYRSIDEAGQPIAVG